LGHGLYVAPSKITVAEWLKGWLEGRQGLAETTRDGYERDARRVVAGLGPIRLRDLTTTSIGAFYGSLTARGLAPATVKNTHAVLHKALEDAVRQGVLARNPAHHAELPRADTRARSAGSSTTRGVTGSMRPWC
jgi:integrase